jgi:hypothetical protein
LEAREVSRHDDQETKRGLRGALNRASRGQIALLSGCIGAAGLLALSIQELLLNRTVFLPGFVGAALILAYGLSTWAIERRAIRAGRPVKGMRDEQLAPWKVRYGWGAGLVTLAILLWIVGLLIEDWLR